MARSAATLSVVEKDTDYTALTFKELMNELSAVRKEMLPYEAKLKPLEDRFKAIKAALLPMFLKEGLKKTSTKTETVSMTEIERVQIDDVEAMIKALKKEGWLHVIDLKVAQSKEYAQLKGKEIPGTHTEVVSRSLRVSAIKS